MRKRSFKKKGSGETQKRNEGGELYPHDSQNLLCKRNKVRRTDAKSGCNVKGKACQVGGVSKTGRPSGKEKSIGRLIRKSCNKTRGALRGALKQNTKWRETYMSTYPLMKKAFLHIKLPGKKNTSMRGPTRKRGRGGTGRTRKSKNIKIR